MGKTPPGCARTGPAPRRLVQQGAERVHAPATHFGLGPRAAARWGGRAPTEAAVRGPEPASAVLTPAEEAAIVSLRQYPGACLSAPRAGVPPLRRPALHRRFRRHGLGRLPPDGAAAGTPEARFRGCPPRVPLRGRAEKAW